MALLMRFLDTVGDGTGTKQSNVNGSVTPVVYRIQPSGAYGRMWIHTLTLTIEDTGSFNSDGYGSGAALTNGITLKLFDNNDNAILDILDGFTAKTNNNWTRITFDSDHTVKGTGPEHQSVRIRFLDNGAPLFLDTKHYLGMTIADDLTGLDGHLMYCQGILG